MIVWLWQAGSAEGVTDDFEKARRTTASFMRSSGTDAAVVEQAYFIPGIESLSTGYERTAGPHWVARRHPGGRISWSLRSAEPGIAA